MGQVGDGQMRADGLDPGAADGQVDQLQPTQKLTSWPARAGPSQNCCPHSAMFPDAGTTFSSSTDSTDSSVGSAASLLASVNR